MPGSETYEIERIVDHVSFIEAYERLHRYKDEQYASIFEHGRINGKKKFCTVSKYFFLVKWMNYGSRDCTWEPESEIPSGVYLHEYKILNNLSSEHFVQKLSFNSEKKGDSYESPKIVEETVEKSSKSKKSNQSNQTILENMPVFLYNKKYNEEFGMVRVTDYTQTQNGNQIVLTNGCFDNKTYIMKKVLVDKIDSDDIDRRLKDYHLHDRSFLQMILKHRNIVKAKESYTDYNDESKNLTINSIYEWTKQTLRQRIQEQVLDWKDVCRDVLSALSFIHPHGIHQNVSLDSIYFDGKGEYKLSNFEKFVFTNSILAGDVKCGGVELAPRKFGLRNSFDFTLDIYALAVVTLQCIEGVQFRSEYTSVSEIEEDIEDAIGTLKTNNERHLLKMMLRARLHIHNGLPSHRFAASTLGYEPVLSEEQDEQMKSVECYYLHTWLAHPIKERLHYKSSDNVRDVMDRLLWLHQNGNDDREYVMIQSTDFSSAKSAYFAHGVDSFIHIVNGEIMKEKMQLAIVPIAKTPVERSSQKTTTDEVNKFIILYKQALAGLPIIFKSAKEDLQELTDPIKNICVGQDHHVNFKKLAPLDLTQGIIMYTDKLYSMEVATPVKNRFEEAHAIEGPLGKERLEWDDMAFAGKQMKEELQDVKEEEFCDTRNTPKRPAGSIEQLEERGAGENKRRRSSDGSDAFIDVVN